jgi:D-aminopeptidase
MLLADRIATYYPRYLSTLALYVGVAAVLFVGLRARAGQRDEARA